VADRLIAHDFAAAAGEECVSIVWDEAPDWRAQNPQPDGRWKVDGE
jgi:hypothetical protein